MATSTTKPLTQKEIKTALAQLPGWTYSANTLVREFTFHSFREALSFMVRAGFEAEAMDHHPDWTNVYNRVTVHLSTHDADDKVTMKDIELAERFSRISWVK